MTKSVENRVNKSNAMNELTVYQQQSQLSPREQKVALAVISLIPPDADEFGDYELSISELSRLTGIGRDHLHKPLIEDICIKLTTTAFVIREPNQTAVVPFFTDALYQHDKSILFKFSPRLMPHLLNLKGSFTTYQLAQITSLSSSYSIRMYEILRQRLSLRDVRAGVTSKFQDILLADLRDWMGIKPKKYQRFNNFRMRVIETAQKELAEKTDLKFSYTPVKGARGKVVGLKLLVQVNASNTVDPQFEAVPGQADTLPECRDPDLLNQLVMAVPTLTTEQAVLLVNSYSRDMVMESLMGLLAVLSSGQINTTPAKYLMGILKNKHRDETQSSTRPERTAEEKLTDRSWAEGLCFDEDWD